MSLHPDFNWLLEMQAQVLMFVQQALYQLSHGQDIVFLL